MSSSSTYIHFKPTGAEEQVRVTVSPENPLPVTVEDVSINLDSENALPAILTDPTSDAQVKVADGSTIAYSDNALAVSDANRKGQLIAEYKSPSDFTAAFGTSSTITLTGLPIAISDDSQLVYVRVVDTAGTSSNVYFNGYAGITLSYSGGTVSITGASPFASGDSYEVGVNGPTKAYDSTNDAIYSEDISPLNEQYQLLNTLDTTNLGADTHYYPSTSGYDMDGYKDLSFTGKFIDADGTVTLTIEASNDEDSTATNRDWVAIQFYDCNAASDASSVTVTNGTITFAIDLENVIFKYVRAVIVNDGATNTVIVKGRRKAL